MLFCWNLLRGSGMNSNLLEGRPHRGPSRNRPVYVAMNLLRVSFFGLMLLLQGCPVSAFPRAGEFRARAKAGQPLVRAIEAFRSDTGHYPTSLHELVPKYLPEFPSKPDDPHAKFSDCNGWEYFTMTNGETVSYSLSYPLGKGGVEYEAPNWIGDDDGHRTVISLGK